MTALDTHRAVEAVWRIESARVIAGLARLVRDLGVAEELAQDALVAALEQWPTSGVPDKPGAWLMATAKHRAIDTIRRAALADRKHQELGHQLESSSAFEPDLDAVDDNHIDDDLLRLIFLTCHPTLSTPSRVALTLRLLGGLSTTEIARAYLTSEATIAQRIVRAKRTLTGVRAEFEAPGRSELPARLASVLEVVYLIFNEGYSATAGDDWMRPSLCLEALRLGRVLVELVPTEPEAVGLVSLMEIQASRAAARLNSDGEPILLLEQDRRRWDRVLINRGLTALESALGRAAELGYAPGPYTLQAAIAACHARATTATDTDWARIAALYETLAAVIPSPVIELNRAVAVGMAWGPERGLALVDELLTEPSLTAYHLLPSVRGDLLLKLGRPGEARAEFERAATLTGNTREQSLLLQRAADAKQSSAAAPPAKLRE